MATTTHCVRCGVTIQPLGPGWASTSTGGVHCSGGTGKTHWPAPPDGEAKVADDQTRWIRADGLTYIAVDDVALLLRLVGEARPQFAQMTEAVAAGLEQVASDPSGWEPR